MELGLWSNWRGVFADQLRGGEATGEAFSPISCEEVNIFFNRPKPAPTVYAKSRRAGLDVNASRIRATIDDRPLALDGQEPECKMVVLPDRKPAEVGKRAYSLIRKSPHQVCTNYFAKVAIDEPKAKRSADELLATSFGKVCHAINAEAEAISLALPGYLTIPQVSAISQAAMASKIPLVGSMSIAMAVVMSRSAAIWSSTPANPNIDFDERPEHIMPLRIENSPGSAVVIDADDHALSASVVWVDRDSIRLLNQAHWPKLSYRLWKDRLLDAVSDRCVRLCRRDPRDNGETEQSLFEQLDFALDAAQANRSSIFHLRAAHWVQDCAFEPSDMDQACSSLTRQTITNLTELIYASGVPAPPRMIWLTADAGKLPGLYSAVYDNSAESTDVTVLNPDAVAIAMSRLTSQWLNGELPRQHIDSQIAIRTVTPMPMLKQKESTVG